GRGTGGACSEHSASAADSRPGIAPADAKPDSDGAELRARARLGRGVHPPCDRRSVARARRGRSVSPPLVSAIMPVFNAEEFLAAALESLLAQDYEPYEIVVCDDGSTDGTAEILAAQP